MKVLKSKLAIPIRFSETDAKGVVWHGNYLKFFEDAREKFGKDFGIEYLDVHSKGYYIPIVKSEISHKASIFYGDGAIVEILLEKHDSAKIVFRYNVYNQKTQQLAATGMTMQVFMFISDRSLELIKPPFYADWEDTQKWEDE